MLPNRQIKTYKTFNNPFMRFKNFDNKSRIEEIDIHFLTNVIGRLLKIFDDYVTHTIRFVLP